MKIDYKKIVITLCMVACIVGTCVGCTTSVNGSESTKNVQNAEVVSTNEEQGSSKIIEKEVEIESNSGEKIEFSIDGAAGDDTQTEHVE